MHSGELSLTATSEVDSAVADFIRRWRSSGPERANFQSFLTELCDLIGVPRPDPTR